MAQMTPVAIAFGGETANPLLKGECGMSMTLGVINLDEYRTLFINEEAFQKFLAGMEAALKFDLRPIVADSKVYGSSLSAERTKDLLAEKFVRRLVQNPDRLTELARRIESDSSVD